MIGWVYAVVKATVQKLTARKLGDRGNRQECHAAVSGQSSSKSKSDKHLSIKAEAYLEHADCKQLNTMRVDAVPICHFLCHDILQ